MRKMALCLIKAAAAGLLAFAILNLLTCIYRGGLPSIADETMSTPVRHVPNTYFSIMTEGISIGVYDKSGFNNAYPAQDSIDYLFLGSSQVEALEVMPNQNLVFRLNERLNSGGKSGYAYNIGTSGEHMTVCVNRLKRAIDTYQPRKAVILETAALDFPQAEIDEALEAPETGVLLYSYSGGIMGFIRKLPYIRLAYIQLGAMFNHQRVKADDIRETAAMNAGYDAALYTERIAPLIQKAVENADGLPIIIFYDPSMTVNRDGAITINGDQSVTRQFRKICDGNGVYFLDMSDRFAQEYEENHILPYGFANTSVGSGHLNKYGHAMIADELYRLISEVT